MIHFIILTRGVQVRVKTKRTILRSTLAGNSCVICIQIGNEGF